MGVSCVFPRLLCSLTDSLMLHSRPSEGSSNATAMSDSFAQSLHINHWQEQLPYPSAFPNNSILIHGFTGIILAQMCSFADKATDWATHSWNRMALPPWIIWGKFSVPILGKVLVTQSLFWKTDFWIPALSSSVQSLQCAPKIFITSLALHSQVWKRLRKNQAHTILGHQQNRLGLKYQQWVSLW